MASNKSLLVLAALFAALLFISSEVCAKELAGQTHEKNAKEAVAGYGTQDHGGYGGVYHPPCRCCRRGHYGGCQCCTHADEIPEPEYRPETKPSN